MSSRATLSDANLLTVDRLGFSPPRARCEVEVSEMAAPPPDFTPRERDVVRGIVAGLTNREMAQELGLKEQGIKNVLSAVFQKCHVRNRLELALFAVRHKIVDH